MCSSDLLNEFEQSLCGGSKPFNIPNEYSIEFIPATMASSKVVKSGNVDKRFTPLSADDPTNVDPDKQSMQTQVRRWSVEEGTPIVQFIDQVMRSSSYVMDQAKYIKDEVTNAMKEQRPLKDLAWYKISVDITNKGWDEGRNDYAYKVKYTVSPYSINN